MKSFETDQIQPGWIVVSSDGQDLGTVLGTEQDALRVKKTGLLGGELRIPLDSVDEVETGRVDVDLTKREAESAQR